MNSLAPDVEVLRSLVSITRWYLAILVTIPPLTNTEIVNARTISVARAGRGPEVPASRRSHALVFGAPLAALLVGLSAEWLDFRELRAPLLFVAGFGILATAYAIDGTRAGWRPFLRTVLIGFGTWGAAQTLYVLLHVARGESFDASRFGPQWSQALGLIAAHGLFLGVPTGIVAALMLQAAARRWPARGA